ncbi:hypothetical protein ACIQXV_00855 [Neobacillus sp. NPDC097160]
MNPMPLIGCISLGNFTKNKSNFGSILGILSFIGLMKDIFAGILSEID